MPSPTPSLWTRRRFLVVAGAAAVGGLAIGGVMDLDDSPASSEPTPPNPSPMSSGPTPSASTGPQTGQRHSYASRPDLKPPVVAVQSAYGGPSPGLIFLTPDNGAAPDGPLIVDNAGHPVWFRPDPTGLGASTFRPITYQGKPALAWWEGGNNNGIGVGDFVIADDTYTEIGRVMAVNGRKADHHEFLVTPRASAMIFADSGIPATQVVGSGPQPWEVLDCAIQEIDLASGRLLFEWHAADHIGLAESFIAPPVSSGILHDYVHANSIEIDTDGNLIMSARNTSTIYKIERGTGAIIWRLGGHTSDFTFGPDAAFSWQHDARRQPDGTLSLFDDKAMPATSRAIFLDLDETAMTANLVRAYAHTPPLQSTSEGNLQVLPNGNVFIGWGSVPEFSEYTRAGELLFDGTFPASGTSYRDMRFPWVGRPSDRPAIAVVRGSAGLLVYASWNGATEIATWQVMSGGSTTSPAVVASAARTGFETRINLPTSGALIVVRAIDETGGTLGESLPVAAPA